MTLTIVYFKFIEQYVIYWSNKLDPICQPNIFHIGQKQCPIKFLLHPAHLPDFKWLSFQVRYKNSQSGSPFMYKEESRLVE